MIQGDVGRCVRGIRGLSKKDRENVKKYLKGKLDKFLAKHPTETFSVRTFVDGASELEGDWRGTPLQILYSNRQAQHSPNAQAAAGSDIGWLFKELIHEHPATFACVREFKANYYTLLSVA